MDISHISLYMVKSTSSSRLVLVNLSRSDGIAFTSLLVIFSNVSMTTVIHDWVTVHRGLKIMAVKFKIFFSYFSTNHDNLMNTC